MPDKLKPLFDRPRAIVATAIRLMRENGGLRPTQEEIAHAIGLKNASGVNYHWRRLIDAGYIEPFDVDVSKPRAYNILFDEDGCAFAGDESPPDEKEKSAGGAIPVQESPTGPTAHRDARKPRSATLHELCLSGPFEVDDPESPLGPAAPVGRGARWIRVRSAPPNSLVMADDWLLVEDRAPTADEVGVGGHTAVGVFLVLPRPQKL